MAPVQQLRVFKPEMEACFNGSSSAVAYFLVAVEQFLRRWGNQFQNEGEIMEYISGCFVRKATQWYMDLYRLGAPELLPLPLFLRAFSS